MSTQVRPSLNEAIAQIIESRLAEVHTMLPARIVKYNEDTGYGTVQIEIKRRFEDGVLRDIPQIPGVPIIHNRADNNSAIVHLPIKVGDEGMVVFSERSLDNWSVKGGSVDPQDPRKFDFTDAVFIVGLNPKSKTIPKSVKGKLAVQYGSSGLRVSKNGKLAIRSNSEDIIGLLEEVLGKYTELISALATDLAMVPPNPLLAMIPTAAPLIQVQNALLPILTQRIKNTME